jgi:integrase
VGTVYKRGEVYRAIVRRVGHPTQSATFPTSREANKWMHKVETELDLQVVTNPRIKIDDLIDKYVKEIAPKRKMAPSHLKHDIPSIRLKFKGMTMADLTGRGLIEWTLKGGSDLTPSTRHWHIARLRGVLRQAEHHWDITIPWNDINTSQRKLAAMGQITLAKERDRRVTDAELAALKAQLNKRKVTPQEDIFDFCVASCMRIAEVVRIRWADLDEQARTVVVRDRKHPTKKYGNHQVVPLLNGAFEIVMRQKDRRKPGADRIWPHGPLYLSKVFHGAADKAGLQDIRLHDLRHEGISRLFELGFSIPEVALVSGHTEWRTLKRYTHVKPQSLVAKETKLREAA